LIDEIRVDEAAKAGTTRRRSPVVRWA